MDIIEILQPASKALRAFEIKHRNTGTILFTMETSSLKLCVDAAVKTGADLRGADLRGADLGDTDNPIIEVKQIGNIGSRGGFTVAFKCAKSIEINCGCFWGKLEEFESRVKETHGDNKYGMEYRAAIRFFRQVFFESPAANPAESQSAETGESGNK